jgi:hypothetical protein
MVNALALTGLANFRVVWHSGSDPGFAFQTGPARTILKSRVHLRTGLLQSHPRSEAFQGDTVCLRVSNFCLRILPLSFDSSLPLP